MNNITNETTPVMISVILPCYNVEKYVDETLQSILSQNYINYEIICLNDGSTDSTKDIIQKYERAYSRITVVDSSHHGLSYQRNKGISLAKGRFIHYMDADDLLHPDFYKKMLKTMIENKLDLLYCEGDAFFETEALERDFSYFKQLYHRKDKYNGVYSGEDIYVEFRKNKDWIVQPCMQMIRKSFLESSQVRFQNISMLEDNIYVLKTMLLAKRVGCLNEQLYYRRVRENSLMTSQVSRERVSSLLAVIDEANLLADSYREKSVICQMLREQIEYYHREYSRLYSLLSKKEQEEYTRFSYS